MKPFRFSLDAVLGLRWIDYQNAMKAYLTCNSACEVAQAQLSSEQSLMQRVCQSMSHHRTALFSVGLQCQYDQTLTLLRAKINDMVADLERLRADCLASKELMLQAKKAYEIVLKVKQKARSTYLAACAKEQEKILDDVLTVSRLPNNNFF
jgi:flagellar export protein FliJ